MAALTFDANAVDPIARRGRYEHIPAEMRATPCWMVSRPDNLKAPCSLRNGVLTMADVHTPANHCSFEAASNFLSLHSDHGLIYALGVGNDFACIDVDAITKVQDDNRATAADDRRALKHHLTGKLYCETSQSGTGLHYVGQVDPEVLSRAGVGAFKKDEDSGIDFLFRSALLMTGNPADGSVPTCGDNPTAFTRAMMLGARVDATENSAQPPVGTVITQYNIGEKRLLALLGSNRNAEAFRTGNTSQWSYVMAATLNVIAEFCTDEALARRTMEQSGLVKYADDKGKETRLEKLNRLWGKEWRKALLKTEDNRAKHAATDENQVRKLDDLPKQVAYVQAMVRQRAAAMIETAVTNNVPAKDFAPLAGYAGDPMLVALAKKLEELSPEYPAVIIEAGNLQLQLPPEEREHEELNLYMQRMIIEANKVNPRNRFAEYNAKFHIVAHDGGRPWVYLNDVAAAKDHSISGGWSTSDFSRAFSHQKVLAGWDKGMPVLKPMPSTWLESERANRYLSRGYNYSTTDPVIRTPAGNILNLFKGWATPHDQPGDCSIILSLMGEVLCNGNVELYDYLIRWAAHMVQRPSEKVRVALLFTSEEEGTGKSSFAELLRDLLGTQYCAASQNAKSFLGDFNVLAKDKVLLTMEEALTGTNKVYVDKLKSLVADNNMMVGQKFKDEVERRNIARVILTSNEELAARVTRNDRRFVVFGVSEKYATVNGKQHPFWNWYHPRAKAQMAAFMAHLWALDISDFNPNDIPMTKAKSAAVARSMTGVERTVMKLLSIGVLPRCSFPAAGDWEVRSGSLNSHLAMIGALPRGFADCDLPAPASLLKVIRNREASKQIERQYEDNEGTTEKKNARYIRLPPLPVARKMFEEHHGLVDHDWDDDNDGDWTLY